MNKKINYLIFASIVLVIFYFGFMNYRNNTDRLLEKFNAHLREGRFEQIYDESSDSVHLNVKKEEFVRRMNVAVGKLKSINPDLNFQVDHKVEQEIFGNDGIDRSSFLRGIQILEKDGNVATIFVYWSNEGIFPKFMDITVITSADQEHYATPGVSYNKISNPEKY